MLCPVVRGGLKGPCAIALTLFLVRSASIEGQGQRQGITLRLSGWQDVLVTFGLRRLHRNLPLGPEGEHMRVGGYFLCFPSCPCQRAP